MAKVGEFKEPLRGHRLELELVPVEELKVVEVQRRPSPHHVKRLMESLRKLGFLVPLIVISREGERVIIDGQHRYLAARELGIKELPCILVPEKLAFELMELNVEKQMSIKEKAYVSLNVYRWYYELDDGRKEAELREAIESAHYVTLGLAYEKEPKLFGSAYESILHRVDHFFSLPLSEALERRQERADLLLKVADSVQEAVAKVREQGIDHPLLPKAIISFANPIGRKRLIQESYEEVLHALGENIKRVIKDPALFLSYRFEGEEEP